MAIFRTAIYELKSMTSLLFFLFGHILGRCLGILVDTFPDYSLLQCQHCQSPVTWSRRLFSVLNYYRCQHCRCWLPISYLIFDGGITSLLLLYHWRLLSLPILLTLIACLTLSLYDFKSRHFPLLIWLTFFLITLIFAPINLTTLVFAILAIWSSFRNLRIGNGDFLCLMQLSLIFDFTQLVWTLQFASLIGLTCYLLYRPKQPLAFVPCLLLGSCLVLIMY